MSTARTSAAAMGDEVVDLHSLPKKRPQPSVPVPAAAQLGAPGIFRGLGFYGMEHIEASILAGLVTGDPVLLIGPHGAAKTALVRCLAGELGFRFWAYDSSKALFEDVIGFPNPKSLAGGVVDYVATPLSVWDKEFLLLDEISRASPAMQNKWLELVRSRRVMGRQVAELRYVFAAMNPPEYLGANPLDEALAGRFAFVIPVPDAMAMNDADLAAIVETATPDDAPLCPLLHETPHPKAVRRGTHKAAGPVLDVKSYLAAARGHLAAIVEEYGGLVTRYVCAAAGELSGRKLQPDGRRLGMLRRNLLAVLAVERVLGCLNSERVAAVFYRTLLHSLPYGALGEAPAPSTLYPCHALAWRAASEGIDAGGLFARIAGRGDLEALLQAYERQLAQLSEEDHHQTLNTILERLDEAKDADLGRCTAALIAFARLVAQSPAHVPSDVVVRALERVHKLAGYGPVGWNAYTDVLDRQGSLTVSLESARQNLALRVAVERGRMNDDAIGHVDADEARARFKQLVTGLAVPGFAAARPAGGGGLRASRRKR
jgi:hypothetical protein